MRKILWIVLALLLCSETAHAQVSTSTASRFRQGSSLPSACNPGDVFYLNTGTVGYYYCNVANAWSTSSSGGPVIATATTYFVCPKTGPGVNCAYNGDGGNSNSNPSDSNACTVKTLPCQTLAGAQLKIAGKHVAAIVTIQLADVLNTGTDCYTPSDVTFDNPIIGGSRGYGFDLDAFSTGGKNLTDAYPTAYVYIQGNTSTPANVVMTGAASCGATTAATLRGIVATQTNFRMQGVELDYFRSIAIHCVGNATNCFLENLNGTDDGITPNANGTTKEFFISGNHAMVKWAGTLTVTNYRLALDCEGMGSTFDDKTPLGNGTLDYTNSTANPIVGIESQEGCHFYLDSGTYVFEGSSAYPFFNAQDGGQIQFTDGAAVTITNKNSNSASTIWKAQLNSYVAGYTATSGGNRNYSNSGAGVTPTYWARAETNSSILLAGTAGKGIACADNQALTGGIVYANWSNGGPVCGDRIALTNGSGAAYAPIHGNDAGCTTECWFVGGNDKRIIDSTSVAGSTPTSRFNANGRHLIYDSSGLWGTNGATDTITIRGYICQVANCASGTKVNLGSANTGAITAGSAISNQHWHMHFDCTMYSTGASATMGCTAWGQFFTAAQTAINVSIPMTSVTTFAADASANEFFTMSAVWNNSSVNNIIQEQTISIVVPY